MKSFQFSLILQCDIQSSPIEKNVYSLHQETHETISNLETNIDED
jgi:hypothetical protein